MKITLIGSRFFGGEMFKLLKQAGHDLTVLSPAADDRLANTAEEGGVTPIIHAKRFKIHPDELTEECDLIVSAHSHAFIGQDVCAKARIAAIGYHPSLLPRWRGIAAVEWTIKAKDPIAGGSVYHLTDEMDAGGVVLQDWCHVYPDDDAASLWRRDLAPMGLRLLTEAVAMAERDGKLPSIEQDPKLVTLADPIKD
jgi:methionyl-tRNA formyltransferase